MFYEITCFADEKNAMYIQYAGTEDPNDPSLFKPTAEWQQIKPGNLMNLY